MEDGVFQEQETYFNEIDWDSFLESIPEPLDLFSEDLNPSIDPLIEKSAQETSDPSPYSDSSFLGEIEHFLLDDNDIKTNLNCDLSPEEFLSGVLVGESDARSGEIEVSNGEIPSPETNSGVENEEGMLNSEGSEENNDNEEDEDPQMSKKRRRQMRNRDSAMKSRERKKQYVRELELKSKYLEGECKRLEYALSCCVMENQILYQRLHMEKACSVSASKQESAVLPLESLLLGSLFWLVSIVCLILSSVLPLPKYQLVVMYKAGRGNTDRETVVSRKPRTELVTLNLGLEFMRRRCKFTRTKMKIPKHFLALLYSL